MSIELTPETVRAAYELLRTTRPFKGWRLPKADDIIFEVSPVPGDFGCYTHTLKEGRSIMVCGPRHGHLFSVLETLAHEMVHLRQDMMGKDLDHDDEFHAIGRRICRIHGFDPKRF